MLPLSILNVQLSVAWSKAVTVECKDRKPDCWLEIRLFTVKYPYSWLPSSLPNQRHPLSQTISSSLPNNIILSPQTTSSALPNQHHPLSPIKIIVSPQSTSSPLPNQYHPLSPINIILSPQSTSSSLPKQYPLSSINIILSPQSTSSFLPNQHHPLSPINIILSLQNNIILSPNQHHRFALSPISIIPRWVLITSLAILVSMFLLRSYFTNTEFTHCSFCDFFRPRVQGGSTARRSGTSLSVLQTAATSEARVSWTALIILLPLLASASNGRFAAFCHIARLDRVKCFISNLNARMTEVIHNIQTREEKKKNQNLAHYGKHMDAILTPNTQTLIAAIWGKNISKTLWFSHSSLIKRDWLWNLCNHSLMDAFGSMRESQHYQNMFCTVPWEFIFSDGRLWRLESVIILPKHILYCTLIVHLLWWTPLEAWECHNITKTWTVSW